MAFIERPKLAGGCSLILVAAFAMSTLARPAAAQSLHDPDCAMVEYRKERFDELRASIVGAVEPLGGVLSAEAVEAASISPPTGAEAGVKDLRLAYRDVIEGLVSAGRYESIRGQIILLLPALKRLGDLRVSVAASANSNATLTISPQQRDQIVARLGGEADKLTRLTQCITSHMRSDR